VEMGPFRFEILRADNRRVYLLKLKIIKEIESILNRN